MNAATATAPYSSSPREACSSQNEPARAPDREMLAHRFRHALQPGETSPLFHLVLRHKQEAV
jgi:hypothetical protein